MDTKGIWLANYVSKDDKFAIYLFQMYTQIMKKPTLQPVEETQFGIYVWEMPDGSWVAADNDGHYMMITSKRGDRKRIAQLRDAARAHGIYEGHPVFLSGKRPVTDEEYEEQRQRMLFGLNPDPEDSYAQLDELRYGASPNF